MSDLDADVLDRLVRFLRECPGRLSAAVVEDAQAGAALVHELRRQLTPLLVEERLGTRDPAGLGEEALAWSAKDCVLLVLFDGREESLAEGAAVAQWRSLNYQRERLATGGLRTCFVLDPENERLFASVASDLWDWTHLFRFFSSPPPVRPTEDAVVERLPASHHPPSDQVTSVVVLRDQLERATQAGLPGSVLARDYAWPLFKALIESGKRSEGVLLWESRLESGAALRERLREEGDLLLKQSKADQVAWVHLSDFHFESVNEGGHDYGRDVVLEALLDDLQMFAGKAEARRGAEAVPLDFLLITGDVAQGGKPAHYAAAERFLTRLREAIDVPPERVFLVPGNHDIDREKDAPEFIRRAAKTKADYQKLWRDGETRRFVVERKLAAYREFALRTNPALGALLPDQPGGFFHRAERNGRTIALTGLSSSWLGHGGDEDRRTLVTGEDQLFDLAGGVKFERLQDADLKLALVHHPLDWMQDFDKDDLEKLLAKNFDLLLRGHLHTTALMWQAFPGRRLCSLAAGSVYEHSDYRNAYNLVQVTFGETRRVKAWLRAYAAGERCFVQDVETYAEAENGIWEWDLDDGERAARQRQVVNQPRRADPAPYLLKLKLDHQYLDIRGIGAKTAERLELRNVYTRLRAANPRLEFEDEGGKGPAPGRAAQANGSHDKGRSASGQQAKGSHDKGRSTRGQQAKATDSTPMGSSLESVELRQVLRENPHLVLVGDPGSGKTTFLRFVSLNLARALLGEDREEAMAAIGLDGPSPFPIFVRLGPFGQHLIKSPQDDLPSDSPEQFYRYLDFSQSGFPNIPEKLLRHRVLEGGCMLLLDGLDEVPGPAARERVGRIVEQVVTAGRQVGNRHLVTSRTRAYQRKVQLSGEFSRFNLAEFGDPEVEQFVTQWSRSLHRVLEGASTPEAEQPAEAYREELLAAIRAHPNVRPMTANPLMLTVLAVVHWSRRKLPEQRAELYDAAVEYLLDSREKQTAYTTIQRRESLQAIARRMFEDPAGVQRTLARAKAAEAIRPVLGIGFDAALEFLEEEELYSNLLVSRMEGEVEFWHLTFQEYLAALGLSVLPGYWAVIQAHLFDDRWSELLLLLAGCRRRLGLALVTNLIQRILEVDSSMPGKARAVGLIGRMLRDIAPYGGDASLGTRYQEILDSTLAIFEPQGAPVSEEIRIEVGEALGQAGDPRLENVARGRVFIAGGTFRMGSQKEDPKGPNYDPDAYDDEIPIHCVTLSGFEIGRFAVTVQEYRRFVDAGDGGYLDAAWWHPLGWEWRGQGDRRNPGEWDDQLRHPNRPVVNVSWYEADAYARWAGGRLPTEAEWEYAARGTGGRKYPWPSGEPSNRHANFDMRVGRPTPVGIYPLGATPEGVLDLAGNVLEWCHDWYASYPKDFSTPPKDPDGPKEGSARVLRGGAFSYGPVSLRAAYRRSYPPRVRVRLYRFSVCVVRGGRTVALSLWGPRGARA